MKKEINYQFVKHTFNPIFDKDSKVLILGSFPSIKSRKNDFYYMNKQNRFWKILSSIYNIDFLSLDTNNKIKQLNKYHIALYDVIDSCEIVGSSDLSIKNVVYTNIDEIINNSSIQRILLNGKKAFDLFIKKYPMYKSISYLLPSTSPANVKSKIDNLLLQWKQALLF